MYFQSDMWFIWGVVSLPNNNWSGLLNLVWWYIERTVKAATDRIPIHGSASSTYVSCSLYVRISFRGALCIIYMVVFVCGFLEGADLVLI